MYNGRMNMKHDQFWDGWEFPISDEVIGHDRVPNSFQSAISRKQKILISKRAEFYKIAQLNCVKLRQFCMLVMSLWCSCFQNENMKSTRGNFPTLLHCSSDGLIFRTENMKSTKGNFPARLQCFSDGLVYRTENMKSTRGNFPTLYQCFSDGLVLRTQNMKSTKGNFPALPNLTFSCNPNIRSTAFW